MKALLGAKGTIPLLLLAVATGASAQEGRVPLYSDLGSHRYAISTENAQAQRYFDQGLRLTYAFNHGEAIRAFTEATRLDPNCAMCYWGIALAHGPNINAAMDEAAGMAAYEAVQQAARLSSGASARERALIRALGARYESPPPADRARLDSAYAAAMRELTRAYPNDLEIATLYAESLMDLSPWAYWSPDGEPLPGTEQIINSLESVLARNPNHPGACHFYIHAVEAAHPEKAVPCADRLAALMPGAGHLVHMPAHIYIRVGRWNDAIESNVHAVHRDEAYIADQRPEGLYPLAYYPHNYHFLSFAAEMAGRSAQAIEAARGVVDNVDPTVARDVPELQALLPYLHLALVRFGRWNDVLAAPTPPADLPFTAAMVEYARGVAFAGKREWVDAEASLQKVQSSRASITTEPLSTVLEIAQHALAGEIEARRGRNDAAIRHFQQAMVLEDGLPYMEPPFWHFPIRHSLGAVLLEEGRAAEAEALYREDLERFPENGWALKGLELSLRAQGRTSEAEPVQARFERAWQRADVSLSSSRE